LANCVHSCHFDNDTVKSVLCCIHQEVEKYCLQLLSESFFDLHRSDNLVEDSTLTVAIHIGLDWIEQGLMSHQTHYRSYQGRVFTGQMTQPTVSKH